MFHRPTTGLVSLLRSLTKITDSSEEHALIDVIIDALEDAPDETAADTIYSMLQTNVAAAISISIRVLGLTKDEVKGLLAGAQRM